MKRLHDYKCGLAKAPGLAPVLIKFIVEEQLHTMAEVGVAIAGCVDMLDPQPKSGT